MKKRNSIWAIFSMDWSKSVEKKSMKVKEVEVNPAHPPQPIIRVDNLEQSFLGVLTKMFSNATKQKQVTVRDVPLGPSEPLNMSDNFKHNKTVTDGLNSQPVRILSGFLKLGQKALTGHPVPPSNDQNRIKLKEAVGDNPSLLHGPNNILDEKGHALNDEQFAAFHEQVKHQNKHAYVLSPRMGNYQAHAQSQHHEDQIIQSIKNEEEVLKKKIELLKEQGLYHGDLKEKTEEHLIYTKAGKLAHRCLRLFKHVNSPQSIMDDDLGAGVNMEASKDLESEKQKMKKKK